MWNRSRRSVTIDLKGPTGVEAFHRLAADADVVVETFRPGVMDRLGIGFDALHARNPRLVYASCPAYPEGHRWADRPGYDALVQASSGQQWEQPGWRMGPIFLHVPMPSMAAMFLVPTGILAALIAREETGTRATRPHVAVARSDAVHHADLDVPRARALGLLRHDGQDVPAGGPPGDDLRGRRRRVGAHVDHERARADQEPGRARRRARRLRPVPLPDALAEERAQITPLRRAGYKARDARRADRGVPRATTTRSRRSTRWRPRSARTARRTRSSWPTTWSRRSTIPVLGKTTQVGVPIHMHGTPGAIQGPQPAPGQHNDEILGALGYSTPRSAAITGTEVN